MEKDVRFKKMPEYENKVVKLVNSKLLVNESVVDQNTYFQCKYASKHFDLALNLNFLMKTFWKYLITFIIINETHFG